MRLNIPAGTAVRFEPGDDKSVALVELAGAKTMHPAQADRSIEGVATALQAGMIAFLVVFCWLVAKRLSIARLEAILEERRHGEPA